jgi:hypothetical protein
MAPESPAASSIQQPLLRSGTGAGSSSVAQQGPQRISPAWPWCERPAQAALGMLFAALALLQTFPFFFVMSEGAAPIWDDLFDLMDGKGLALMLGATTVLACIAGATAHGAKRALVSSRAIYWLVHAVNIAPLAFCPLRWWGGSLAASEWGDLMEDVAYISGVMCQWDMGLCLLPLARESAWLNSAVVAYPEGIPFHRLTGWWCIAMAVVHSIAEILAVMTETWE